MIEQQLHVGILGGGQLGRMMAQAGHRLGINITIVDPKGVNSPAGQISSFAMKGSFNDEEIIRQLANKVDILTVEIEHINTNTLLELEKEGKIIHPSPRTLQIIQDKYNQKIFLQQYNIPIADFLLVQTRTDADNVANQFGYPFMMKSRTMAYDGNGNAVVNGPKDIELAWQKLKGENGMLYAERWVPYVKELAVMIVRSCKNQVHAYPLAETVQQNNICHTVLVPAQVNSKIEQRAIDISLNAVEKLTGAGIFGVELFLTATGEVFLKYVRF